MITRPALFASAYAPHVGGVEELVRQLAAEQRRRGMEPLVVSNRYPKVLPAREHLEQVEVLRHVFRVPEPNWRQLGGWALLAGRTRLDIRHQLRVRRADLVHVQCVSSNARFATAAAHDLRLPLVVSMQGELGMDATGVYQRSAQMRRTWRRSLDRASVVTTCSQFVLDEALEHYGRPLAGRARVVPNGIRLADFAIPAAQPSLGRPYVLGIGRMVPQKGFDVLIEAFQSTAASHPDVELLLVGDGPCRQQLQAQAVDSTAAGRIRFLGSLGRDRVVPLFIGATAFVLSSRIEPQGIVLLEAMAARTPVVAARVGGVEETVQDGVNGLLFDGGSAAGLAEQLGRVVENRALASGLVERGLVTAAQHDWTVIADRYADAYLAAAG